jgi:L-aspartate oxidase
LHGANRLASNSLLEGLVYGAHAGEGASNAALKLLGTENLYSVPPLDNAAVLAPAEPLDLVDIRNSLKALMWRAAGVRRSKGLLEEALATVDQWRRYVLVRQFEDAAGWELQNMLAVSRIMIEAALAREESRGVHLRTDFPKMDDAKWNRHLWFVRDDSTGVERSGVV